MLPILFFGLQLINLALLGLLLARLALKDENRLIIVLPFAGLVSTCIQVWLLSWIALALSLTATVVVVNIVIALASGLLWWRTRLNLWQWAKSWRVGASVPILILTGISLAFLSAYAIACVHLNRLGAGVGEPQFVQQAFTTSILRGNYPPISPYEPDYPLLYHWIYDLWAAGLARTAGFGSSGGILISTVWLSVLLWWGGFAFFYRQTGGVNRSFVAAWLLVAATNTSWLGNLQNLSSFALGDIIKWLTEKPREQLLIAHNLDNIYYNYTIPFGYMAFVACLWCYQELISRQAPPRLTFSLAVISLAVLIGSSEALTGGFAAAIVGAPLLTWLLSYRLKWPKIKADWRSLAWPIALLVVGLAASLPVQSVITNLYDRSGGKIELTFTEHFGELIGIARRYYSIFSWFFVWQTGFLPLLIVPMVYLYWRRFQDRVINFLILAGLVIFVFSALFYPKLFPPDNSRFYAAWYCLLIIAVFLGLVRLYEEENRRWLKYTFGTLITGLSLLWLVPGLMANMPRTVNAVQPTCYSSADEAAAQFIASHTTYGERIMIVPGPEGFYIEYEGGFYRCNRAGLMGRVVMQFTGGPIPIGFTLYNHVEEYRFQYVRAMRQLDETDLRSLKINLLYVDPNELNELQKARLAELSQQGKLELLGQFQGSFYGPANSPTAYPPGAVLVRQVYRLKL